MSRKFTKKKLVHGVAVNDADYNVARVVEGKLVTCKLYKSWVDMVGRCFSARIKENNKTYLECTLCNEWLSFTAFREWAESQDWHGKQLDKDLLVDGNKHYSPETCVFISRELNSALTYFKTTKNKKTGAFFHRRIGKFTAACKNPFTRKLEHIGVFDDENSAHKAWLNRKREIFIEMATAETDLRISDAIRAKFVEELKV